MVKIPATLTYNQKHFPLLHSRVVKHVMRQERDGELQSRVNEQVEPVDEAQSR